MTILQDLGVGSLIVVTFPDSQESKASKQSPEVAERQNQEIRGLVEGSRTGCSQL